MLYFEGYCYNQNKQLVKIGAEIPDFNVEDYLDPKEAKRIDRFIQFAVIASEEACKDSGLNLEEEDLTNEKAQASNTENKAFYLATSFDENAKASAMLVDHRKKTDFYKIKNATHDLLLRFQVTIHQTTTIQVLRRNAHFASTAFILIDIILVSNNGNGAKSTK